MDTDYGEDRWNAQVLCQERKAMQGYLHATMTFSVFALILAIAQLCNFFHFKLHVAKYLVLVIFSAYCLFKQVNYITYQLEDLDRLIQWAYYEI